MSWLGSEEWIGRDLEVCITILEAFLGERMVSQTIPCIIA